MHERVLVRFSACTREKVRRARKKERSNDDEKNNEARVLSFSLLGNV